MRTAVYIAGARPSRIFKAPEKSNKNLLRNILVKKESSLRNVGLPVETRDSTGFDLLNTRKPWFTKSYKNYRVPKADYETQ